MVIHIYYGGRGVIDDPTRPVIERMQKVLEELRVNVVLYNLYEYKNTIPTLSQTVKDADGIILASTVEWFGMGGYMLQFLDACWQFGDKSRISEIYMMPIVIAKTYGEKQVLADLSNAWETLGGKVLTGLSGYVDNPLDLDVNPDYISIVESQAEKLYRGVNQREKVFPSSKKALTERVGTPNPLDLSVPEAEQLSKYVSDENYVRTQKEDIQELAVHFKGMLMSEDAGSEEEYISEIKRAFKPTPDVSGTFVVSIEEKKNDLIIAVSGARIDVRYDRTDAFDVKMKMNRDVMEDIVSGRMSFQRAFMSGAMASMKGDFGMLSSLDKVLSFTK
ncbi:MAG: SCP2 sterol-binding domain-containing protein [Lachnospiraceae bacterium]|nr:SCP2 sterol-binding domain-containing protein [Lachnospiraceae bacterium]